jgi:CBS domain-containing protein
MPVGSYCRRSICTAQPDETIAEVAQRMEKEGIGLLAVVEDGRPVGVLTDRDIALHRDPADPVADAMTSPATTIGADASLAEAIDRMVSDRMRRVLVTDGEGRALGVLALDDLVRLIASEFEGLAAVAAKQIPGASASALPVAQPGEAIAIRPVEHYARRVVELRSDAPASRAIEEMRKAAIGCVVVTDGEGEPVGMVTDRDIALRVMGRSRDPELTVLSAIMSAPAVTCEATRPLEELIAVMRDKGIRRMPVTHEGRLFGIVTFDDLLVTLGAELQRLGSAVVGEVRRELVGARAEQARARASEKLKEAASHLGDLGGEAARKIREEIDSLREVLRRYD